MEIYNIHLMAVFTKKVAELDYAESVIERMVVREFNAGHLIKHKA